jgi:hypothetical protein
MNENVTTPSSALPTPEQKPRRRLRLAAIGGIAAIAIIGGGIGAVASAEQPTAGTPTTSTVLPSTTSTVKDGSGAGSTTAPTTGAAGAPAAPTRPAPKPHLAGTVTSVSGSTVLIKDREGFTRTIVLSSKIHAEGTVDANGTSLDAVTVGADKGPMGGPGRGDGGPMGGPGRGRHGGFPAGAPDGRGPATTGTAPASPTAPVAPTTSSVVPTS